MRQILLHFQRRQITLYAGLLLLGLIILPSRADAADLLLSPSTGTYSAGETFTATVRVVPGSGEEVNAVEATLAFDPSVLSVVNVNRDNSVFNLWTTEPTFSNSAGTVEFGGGTPSPFTNTSNVLSVTFRTVAEGDANITFTDASVLVADGQGTDVFGDSTNGSYTVSAATTPEPTPEPSPQETAPAAEETDSEDDEAIIFGDPPQPPEIGSQTFLDPDVWYSETSGLFTWTLPFDVNAVAIEITDDPENRPEENEDAIFDPPVEEYSLDEEMLSDGVQYLSINYLNQVGWGAPTNRKLQIDNTPPEPFPIVVQQSTDPDGFPTVRFEAEDEASGIDYYELTIADKEPVQVTPDEANIGYLLTELEDGTYTVTVVAHDRAGNTRESQEAVQILAGWTAPVETEEERTIWSYFTSTNIFIAFLVIVILLQSIYFWYEHKHLREREEKLRRETREIQDQMEKIFSALRDEIHDQILSITKRKRLSAKEKEAIEGLTQALEVSETLIEKEINDVNTILR
ncbi:MAG: cohesin domain-containing protein [Patescibacteria group bacterium]